MTRALIIDIGNTRQKLALFRNGRLSGKVRFAAPSDVKSIRKMLQDSGPDLVFVSSVHKQIPRIPTRVPVLSFNSSTPVPLKNRYKTRFSLGSDRLAAAVAAVKLFPGIPVLVIDAGTCIKFNFVNARGEYLGGSISPGLGMRFLALHNFTERLPFIKAGHAWPLIGRSTEGSIRSGVMNGTIAEMKGMIESYLAAYPRMKVLITGGDAACFVKRLKMRIFARPNLILEGLNAILEFNVRKSH